MEELKLGGRVVGVGVGVGSGSREWEMRREREEGVGRLNVLIGW